MSWLTEILPNYCCQCAKRLTATEKMLCLSCWHHINPNLLAQSEIFDAYTGICLQVPIVKLWCCAKFTKGNWMQGIMHQLKYKNQPSWSGLLIRHYERAIRNKMQSETFDAIIGTPIHSRRKTQRGYNQVDAMGQELSRILGIPYDTNWLIRTKYSKSQTRKNRIFRQKNSQNVFGINPKKQPNYQHILLIDDILTTGATLIACCQALQSKQPVQISIFCLGYTDD